MKGALDYSEADMKITVDVHSRHACLHMTLFSCIDLFYMILVIHTCVYKIVYNIITN